MSQPPADHVILIVIDGLRPDALLQAASPAVLRLIERGAFTLSACTVMPPVTLPAHMSMFHSVLPEVHGVTANLWRPMPGEPIPSIADWVYRAGKQTASFYTWEQLRALWSPGSLGHSVFINIYGPRGAESDLLIAEEAATYFTRFHPEFTFLYLGLTDEVGHRNGWMSPEYLRAAETAGEAVGRMTGAVERAGLGGRTACLLLADHGGNGRGHGEDRPEDMTIPWIIAGAGVRQGCRLQGPVSILDTAPTLAHLLGLPCAPGWQGKVITEALE